MENTILLVAALTFVCAVFAFGAWIVDVIASKQNEPARKFLPDTPVMLEGAQSFNPLLRDALDKEHKAQQQIKREVQRARQNKIITNLQDFYAMRPRPWLSPNARARKVRHG